MYDVIARDMNLGTIALTKDHFNLITKALKDYASNQISRGVKKSRKKQKH